MSKVLVVVAHPDDESFWMGGMIAKMVQDGHRVFVAALTDGVDSRFAVRTSRYYMNAERRDSHFDAALRALGAERVGGIGGEVFPDQKADTVPQLVINRAVHALIQDAQPDAVYTHWVGDLNLDHRRTAEAVLVATRPGTYRCQVFAMTPEYPRRCVGPKFEPNVTVDISDVLETKLKACQCYVDEMRWYPHPRSERAILEQTTEQFYAYD